MAELFKLMGTIAIDATDATKKIDAVITAGDDLEAKLNGIGTNAESYIGSKSGFGTASVWLGNVLSELTNRAAQLGKEFVLSGLKYNATMEGYEVTFGTLLNGDMEKAKQLMADIQSFALNSPLSVSGVSAAALQLLNVGTAYEDVMPMLEMLGNLSLGDANKMDRLGTALSQVMGFGQLYGQEKSQFVNAGVPLYTLLEDYYKIAHGKSPEEIDLGDMQKNGEILSEHVLGALQLAAMSSEEILEKYGYSGERAVSFYNAMAAMLPTYTGQTQKAGEQTEMTASAIVAPFQEKATETLLPAYSEMMQTIGEKAVESADGGFLDKISTAVVGWATGMMNTVTNWMNGEFENKGPGTWVYYTDDPDAGYQPEGLYSDPTFHTDPNAGKYGEAATQEQIDLYNSHAAAEEFAKFVQQKKEEKGLFDGLNDWFVVDSDTKERRFGTPSFDFDGLGGNNGFANVMATLQQQLSTLKTDISSAAQEGVANGLSGVTITGTITTGTVKLDSGTVVGELAPRLNLQLGWMNKVSSRG